MADKKDPLEQTALPTGDATPALQGFANAEFTDFMQEEPEYMNVLRDEYTRISDTITAGISDIQDQDLGLDTDALVSEVRGAYEKAGNSIVDASLAEAEKQTMEMDAYFGSGSGDVRSAARSRVANAASRNLMKGAWQAISQVYTAQAKDVVSTAMEAGKTNAQIAAQKSQAIGNLIQQSVSLFGTTASAINQNYLGRMSAATQWAGLQADVAKSIDQLEMEQDDLAYKTNLANLEASVRLLTSKEYGSSKMQKYGTPQMGSTVLQRTSADQWLGQAGSGSGFAYKQTGDFSFMTPQQASAY